MYDPYFRLSVFGCNDEKCIGNHKALMAKEMVLHGQELSKLLYLMPFF